MARKKKVAAIAKDCVACGCCAAGCPRGAISIYRGVCAQISTERCVGCGKCEDICPAQVVSLVTTEAGLC